MQPRASFGRLVRERRKALDLTQEQLAQVVGCALDTVRKIEADLRRPSRHMAQRLAEALSLDETQALAFIAHARAAAHPDAPANPSPSQDQHPRPPRQVLPSAPNELLGREEELFQTRQLLLRPEVRLLTLLGAGGVGKTRLALQLAHELREQLEGEIFWIPLAPLRDTALLPEALLHGLDLQQTPGHAAYETLVARLAPARTLLVLDNVEHLLEAAPELARLLADCPHLKLLTTSRAPLHISHEQRFPVAPLSHPEGEHRLRLDVLASYPAVSLFIARASRIQPGFTLSESSGPAIAQLCRQLGGLPLAIELAAARINLFPPHVMLAQLRAKDGVPWLDILTQGPRDADPRHRSLRSAIAWSYELLSPQQRALYRCSAIFAGGCTLEALLALDALWAQEPAGDATQLASKEMLLLEALTTLVNNGLLEQAPGAEAPRFILPEMIREFALEQLRARGEYETARLQHADYFLRLIEVPTYRVKHAQLSAWLGLVEREYDNLRGALGAAHAEGDAELLARLCTAVVQYWVTQAHHKEASIWYERALALRGRVSIPRRARLLNDAAVLHCIRAEYTMARALLQESLALWEALDNSEGLARCLNILGSAAMEERRYAEAHGYFERVLTIDAATDDRRGMACTLNNLGMTVSGQGDYPAAQRHFEQALLYWQDVGEIYGQVMTMNNLGRCALDQGQHAAARARYLESLRLSHEIGAQGQLTYSLIGLAHLALQQEHEPAHQHWAASRAARLSAVVAGLQATGVALEPTERALHEQTCEQARAALGEQAFARAWHEGLHMSRAQAVTYAVAEERHLPAAGQLRPLRRKAQ